MGRARVILHIDPKYHDRFTQTKRLAMFGKIHDIITARGGEVLLAIRPKGRLSATEAHGDGDLHVVESSNARGTGWLNSSIAYLTGYWHLDGMGILSGAEMAARGDMLPPAPPDAAKAAAFFGQLCSRFKDKRRTRHQQPETTTPLPQGCIAVFLQGRAPERNGQHFFTGPEIIEAAALGAGGRTVLIKPHPLFWDEGAQMVADAQAQGLAVQLAQAHIHDLLAACAVTVSINSAAAIEGFLHGKPTILCGRADFAAMGETLIDPDAFTETLQRALTTSRDYAGWLCWYLTQHAIAIDAPDADTRILARFARAGFDAERLGLR
jgi:hypothetical protein